MNGYLLAFFLLLTGFSAPLLFGIGSIKDNNKIVIISVVPFITFLCVVFFLIKGI